MMHTGQQVRVPRTRQHAIDRYIATVERLPTAEFPAASLRRHDLGELVDDIDAFVLDGFGVLNIGDSAVPGAVERVAALKAMGKRVLVLTNGSTLPPAATQRKYAAWGFDFDASDIVSSRDALERGLKARSDKLLWGIAAPDYSHLELLGVDHISLGDTPENYKRAQGFVLLSTADWTDERQALLESALAERPREVLIGNPDLVAPRETSLSIEPGYYAHALADRGLARPEFFGKPFANVFEIVRERLHGIPPTRIAMVGDTLHTDILGGASFGWQTVLIEAHGLFRGIDPESAMQASGIRPNYICSTT